MESKIDITSDRLQNKIAIEFIEQHISKNKKLKLLDVGSADNIIKHYLPKNVEYYSLELPKEEQDEELRKYKHEIILDLDKEKIPVKNNFFDIIVALDVLEHTLFPEKVLEEFRRITKKEGLFIISIPNEYNILQRMYYLFGIKTRGETPWKVVEMHQHVQKPRVKDIINLLSGNSQINEIKYIWMSRASYKNKSFIVIDKIISVLAQLHPSLFAVNVIAMCKNKKALKQKNKIDYFSTKNRQKYY